MSSDPKGTATAAIARFVASPGVAPDAALQTARRIWLNTVLAAACGAGDALVGDVGAVCRELHAGDGAVSAQWRAFQATLAAGVPDRTDDPRGPERVRCAAAVACAAVAVAGPGTTVGALLDAMARGVEVSARVSQTFVPARPDPPWDSGAVAARFGAAGAAGRLLGLDRRALVHAFGLAGGQAGGLAGAAGTANERVQLARASFDGVEAALLARRGFTASADILDGVGGVGDVLYGASDYGPLLSIDRAWASAPAGTGLPDGTAPTPGDNDHDLVARADALVARGLCPPELRAAVADHLDGTAEPVPPLLRYAAPAGGSSDG